jgi:hypothetical protein
MQVTTVIGIVLVGLVLTGMAATCIGSAASDAAQAVNAHNAATTALIDALSTR